MKRNLFPYVLKDLDKKIVMISGPRQVGKTTLSKLLFPKNYDYLNMDVAEHRLRFQRGSWSRDLDLVIFDELHKIKNWKRSLKGVFDTEGVSPRILVTGSARLDTFRRGGDSLAGRFFSYRLHPFSVAEVKGQMDSEIALDRILDFGGFPEPFIQASKTDAARWRRGHIDRILREDILDLTPVRDLKGIETLVELVRGRVGSSVSYESLARDLQVSAHTVKHWLGVLESLHVVFLVYPYSKNIARSLVKQPKIYLYDTGNVSEDPGCRFENAVASALLKHLHYLEDTQGKKTQLYYLKDTNKKEVDFVLAIDGKVEAILEVKWSEEDISQLRYFSDEFPKTTKKILLVKNLNRDTDINGIKVRKASQFLAELEK